MTVWLRSGRYTIVGERCVRPGEAVRFDGSPLHNALADEVASGRVDWLELVECDHDPSTPAPPDEATFGFQDTRGSAGGALITDHTGKVIGHEHLGDVRLPDPGRVEPEPATPPEVAAYQQHVAALEKSYAEQRGFPDHTDHTPTTSAEEATRS